MKPTALIIYAPNVHRGGGCVLLNAILEEILDYDNCIVVVDIRFKIPPQFPQEKIAFKVKPTLIGRLSAEWWLHRLAVLDTRVLCFGNLPPLLKLRAKVFLFAQNMYLVSKTSLKGFQLISKARIYLEKLWMKFFIHHVDEVIVQSQTMQDKVAERLGLTATIMPFVEERHVSFCLSKTNVIGEEAEKRFDFLYVASGEPHKNHRVLVEAWKILAKKNTFPSLCLTVPNDDNPALCKWIESQVTNHRLRIENIGIVGNEQMESLYMQVGALIYPSLLESLGLPLIEARRVGLPIIASELDYVRDVLNPEQSFDPRSAVSIARAVERFLGIERPHTQVTGARTFIEYLTQKART